MIRIGILGCGKISDAYFAGLTRYSILKVVACADLDLSRAEAKAAQHGVRALTIDALLASGDVDLIVNARVACDPELLKVHVESVIAEVCQARAATPEFRQTQSFRPGRPVPTHRFP